MKEFQILRYLAKGKLLIFIIALVGALGVYYYASSNQSYTAMTAIRYANDAIDQGLAPNGSALDVTELYSSTVISGAIDDLGLDCTVDEIRSKFKVEPINPEEEETNVYGSSYQPESYQDPERNFSALFPEGREENLFVDQLWVAKLLAPGDALH